MFQVSVERSRSDNMIPKCSFEFSANSKCFANYLAKYRCEINFLVSRCPQLLLQQDQEADYHIRMFAKNSIGNSSLTKTHILCKLNIVQHNYISIIINCIFIRLPVYIHIIIRALSYENSCLKLCCVTFAFMQLMPTYGCSFCSLSHSNSKKIITSLSNFYKYMPKLLP